MLHMNGKAILRIAIFYLIGISISNVFRFDLLDLSKRVSEMPVWIIVLFAPLGAIGLWLGALLSIKLLRKERATEYSLFGSSTKWSIIMAVIPIFLLAVIGVENTKAAETHYYGLAAGIGTFIYCIFEEYGWRGYLQEELIAISEWKRIIIIGFLWYFWHLLFLKETALGDNLIFLSVLIAGTWGIGKVMEMTKSVFAAACFHMIIQIMMFNSLIKNGIDRNEKILILGVAVTAFIVILKYWKKAVAVEPVQST